VAEPLIFLVLVCFWVSFVAAQVLSWRRSTGERRQQLKWLMSGSLVALGAGAVDNVISALDQHQSAAVQAFSGLVNIVGLAAFAVCVGVAIMRYRLYEIDRVISRTLAYAIITGLLIGVYAGLVLLATQVLRLHSTVAVAASTLAAAALFTPLRRRVQTAVDRRFNRARYDAELTVAAFAGRLKDAVDLDMIRGDLATVVQQTLEPAHVSVWMNERG
jgi:O-antigen/teichoic acid export membrane protein